MYLFSAQNNFKIKFICRRACAKKFKSQFYVSNWFPDLRIWMFFGKFTVKLVLKSFSRRNNSLGPPVFLFSKSLPRGRSRVLWILSSWVWGFGVKRHSKMQKLSAYNFFFFCDFELPLWIYYLLWNTNFCFF